MDFSETYIKMRVDARDVLLDGKPPLIGTDIEDETIDPEWITHNVFVDIKGDFYYSFGIDYCQLERQDQLQMMVGDNWVIVLDKFGDFVNDNCADEWSFDNVLGYGSMEQLWLAFVMWELHHKVWYNGSEWRDIDDGTKRDTKAIR